MLVHLRNGVDDWSIIFGTAIDSWLTGWGLAVPPLATLSNSVWVSSAELALDCFSGFFFVLSMMDSSVFVRTVDWISVRPPNCSAAAIAPGALSKVNPADI